MHSSKFMRIGYSGLTLFVFLLIGSVYAEADTTPTSLLQSPEIAREQCVPPDPVAVREAVLSNPRSFNRADVVAGVDSLGRLLLALDVDRDGFADEMKLFTGSERFPEMWSESFSGFVLSTSGTLVIAARDKSVLIAIATNNIEPPGNLQARADTFNRAFVNFSGIEMVGQSLGPSAVYLNDVSAMSPAFWPETFQDDLLSMGTAIPNCANCQSETCRNGGGCGSTGCAIGGDTGGACQTSCAWPFSFACCDAGFLGNKCRCVVCSGGTDLP
ncbi:MAG: hypothetical protein AAAFM81_14250 [Pseudomonadota bacterium]